jgi:cytoskeletal protein RodZ
MTPLANGTPREFGQALKRLRESAGVPLEAITARSKIGSRMLAAIEEGEFGRLPNQVFARIFVRQYLEIVGAAPEDWLPGFEDAWRRFAESSQPLPVGSPAPAKQRRLGPWMIGLVLVGAGVAAVLLLERRQAPAPAETATIPAVAIAPLPSATPAAAAATAPAEPAPAAAVPPPTTLVVKALQGPCWVEVRINGEMATSRLLGAGAVWEIPAGGRGVDLVLGDAGAASVAYMGDVRNPVGRSGEVARIHLPANTTPAAAP